VEAPGIENEPGRTGGTISRRGSTIRHEREPGSVSTRAATCADAGGSGTESSQVPHGGYELRDVVEPALAGALMLAAQAHPWELVAQIAAELGARRQSRDGAQLAPANTRCASMSRDRVAKARLDSTSSRGWWKKARGTWLQSYNGPPQSP
jgi:hypothetical protein